MTVDTSRIVRAAIYPPIGVTRIGNSPDAYYIGPEVPYPEPKPAGSYRDTRGRLKREAARFRVYGLDVDGRAVAELTADNAAIQWSVELENQKSAWYNFELALDIPEAASAKPTTPRNANVTDRSRLIIKPGARTISGKNHDGADARFTGGKFMGTEVYLGELKTDDAGRLIVLGGHGVSASYDGKPATTFANNEGWHDDTSDGPVTARVVLDGRELEVDSAWVICAPPNYAPQQKSVRTMWDLMRSLAVDLGMLDAPSEPSFQNDIRPIFERMTDLQWVNQGFAAAFGHRGPFYLGTPDWLARLNDRSDANKEMRRTMANNFRRFELDSWSAVPWPWLYGDAMSAPEPAHTPRQNAELSDLQLAMLDKWAAGTFIADYEPKAEPPRELDQVPVAEQPDVLTQAAMEFCLADAFHPGCEMTWPMRGIGMYMAPYRIKHRVNGMPEPDYGPVLTPKVANSPGGPVNGGQVPGSITRWMAVPWQTDTASCRSGYNPDYDPYLPTFWPARVPNQVMSETQYATVLDRSKPEQDRVEAFSLRADWFEPLGPHKPYEHQINYMIHNFDQMGVVEVMPGVTENPLFPSVMQVSDQKPAEAQKSGDGAAETVAEASSSVRVDLRWIEKVRRFPDGSDKVKTN